MKLSVVIVNYNVQYFLEQCLLSVERAIKGMDAEVFVVDNNSVDGSVEMVAKKFPWVRLIANKENTGFSRANNQAMEIATGEYFLLLNPDTLVEEDTFTKVINFMDTHPDAGGLGVKMVDGKGVFLPESKRGLPTPATSFYKISGLSRIFRKSGKFNRYHLGHLSPEETHEVEILSGAFMLMRKKTLDKVGLLDPAFFMYGEDIDLSWRIIQGGWKNYYFPDTRIIHYKGESTKKGSLNYVYVFYNAMVIFAKKHFSEKNAKLFSFLINVAIWLRAGVAILNRFFRRLILPIADAILVLGGLYLIKDYYASSTHNIYDPGLVKVAFLSYVAIWCCAVWLGSGYDKPYRPGRVVKPLMIGSAIILIGYSLLPESLRFSRALILFGTLIALISFILTRVIVNLIQHGNTGFGLNLQKRMVIIGNHDEAGRVKSILAEIRHEPTFSAIVSPGEKLHAGDIGRIDQLDEIVRIHKIDQVIFCARDISSSDIIGAMSRIDDKSIEFKIAPPESLYIIGSGSIETSGDAYMLDVNSVSLLRNKRAKRVFDIAIGLLMIPFLPVMIFIVKNPFGLLANVSKVILGKKTWVGYAGIGQKYDLNHLPKLPVGVVNPASGQQRAKESAESVQKLNVLYAKDYRLFNDIRILWNGKRSLDK